VVELIAAATTKTGLKVECALDERAYEKGIKITDAEMEATSAATRSILNGTTRSTRVRKNCSSCFCRSPNAAPKGLLVQCLVDSGARGAHRAPAGRPRRGCARAYWRIKQRARQHGRLGEEPAYSEIEMPRNSPTGFICAFFATFMGFALIWHIWWLVAVSALGAYATFVVFAWRDRVEYIIPADVVARIDRANRSARSEALAGMQAAP
jgi:Rhodopirellula transposase DDE domain